MKKHHYQTSNKISIYLFLIPILLILASSSKASKDEYKPITCTIDQKTIQKLKKKDSSLTEQDCLDKGESPLLTLSKALNQNKDQSHSCESPLPENIHFFDDKSGMQILFESFDGALIQLCIDNRTNNCELKYGEFQQGAPTIPEYLSMDCFLCSRLKDNDYLAYHISSLSLLYLDQDNKIDAQEYAVDAQEDAMTVSLKDHPLELKKESLFVLASDSDGHLWAILPKQKKTVYITTYTPPPRLELAEIMNSRVSTDAWDFLISWKNYFKAHQKAVGHYHFDAHSNKFHMLWKLCPFKNITNLAGIEDNEHEMTEALWHSL